ncbi:MAG: YqzL family protein [Clostridia bacterium]|nr:MAG: YqzL family protein [Clostridia bacterium]
MCEADFIWSIFVSTGSIDAYLMYKELQRQQAETGAEEPVGAAPSGRPTERGNHGGLTLRMAKPL